MLPQHRVPSKSLQKWLVAGEKLTPRAAGTMAGKGDGASSLQRGGWAQWLEEVSAPPAPLSALWVDAIYRPMERIWGRSSRMALAGLSLCGVRS